VPTSLQYPLERERALERRWHRLLQRTVAPKKDLRQDQRASASPRRSPSSAFSAPTAQSRSDPAKVINRPDHYAQWREASDAVPEGDLASRV
jgi:hypothetical protein